MVSLPHVVLALSLIATALAQQVGEDWNLRQPCHERSAPMAIHPTTGRPVLYGGAAWNAGLPHLWEWTGNGWLRHAGPPGPPAPQWALLATDELRGQLVLFSTTGTWTWDGARWDARPGPLGMGFGGTMPVAYDSLRGRIVVFSGLGPARHTWEWDGTAWTSFSVSPAPGPRFGHAMAYDAARGRVVLHGGWDDHTASGYFDDTWEWDGTSWQQRVPIASPPPREQHVMAHDPLRQRVVLFGGVHQATHRVDTWEWDGANWASVTTVHRPPPLALRPGSVESSPRLLFDRTRSRVALFQNVRDAIWEYDGIDWSQVVPASLPVGRANTALVHDTARGNLVLFGGYSLARGLHGDTWTWNGQRWTEVTTATGPSPRSGHAMAFDAARGEVVLFGGSASMTSQMLDDTWVWNGTWRQVQPANRPARRVLASLAFHAPSQRLVLFGGRDGPAGAAMRGDTWTWDGSNWQLENPTTSPTVRTSPAMSRTAQDVVLFGGTQPNNPTGLNDTWTWNGSNWTQLQPATSPPARVNPACAWDSDRSRVLLVSSPNTGTQVETWAFDGTNWQQLVTPTATGTRSGHAVAYDPRHRELVMFGGLGPGPGGYLDGTWTLAVARAQDTFGAGCAGTLGTPALQTNVWSTVEPGGLAAFDVVNLPHSIAMMVAGFSRTAAGSLPLPLSLQPIGMPGCNLLVSPDASALLVGTANAATWSLPVPPAPGLLGFECHVQAFVWDPPANAAGITVSNGGRCRVGN